MTLALGIDTGGTFTDAVIVAQHARDMAATANNRHERILRTAKSLTTRDDLSRGIGAVIERIMTPEYRTEIGMVSLSTTLATNAMVEGHGRPAGLILIGQSPAILQRAKLGEAVGTDPVIHIAGGHDAHGEEQAPLDEAALLSAADQFQDRVCGFAVASYFAVRNAVHERRAKQILHAHTGLPVTCSHELSSRLDAPRRALTALINARLVPLVTELIEAVYATLNTHRIDAPLMIVQGDGSLALAGVALERPVETILSGPAASVIGARWLAAAERALVADIGGTTTDVALLDAGAPARNRDGASVGGWRTMVEAIDVRTFGLGGDSEIAVDQRARLTVGPQRAVPLSLLGAEYESVLDTLRHQLAASSSVYDGQFAVALQRTAANRVQTKLESHLMDAIADAPLALRTLYEDPRYERALQRLRRRGVVALAAFTPTDALHIVGRYTQWSVGAARMGATLLARRLTGGDSDRDVDEVVAQVTERVEVTAARMLIDTVAASEFGQDFGRDNSGAQLIEESLRGSANMRSIRAEITIGPEVVAIGAPAAALIRPIAKRLNATVTVPPHADVCNAVGAAVGGIVRRISCTITQPVDGTFRVHGEFGTQDFKNLPAAKAWAIENAAQRAEHHANLAGCDAPNLEIYEDDRVARAADDSEIFVESSLSVTAFDAHH